MSYQVIVVAHNKKGKSSPVVLPAYTVKNPEKQTGISYFDTSQQK